MIFICRPAWAGPIFTANFSQTLTWNHEEEEEKKCTYSDLQTRGKPSLLVSLHNLPGSWGRGTTASTCPGAGPLAETVSGAGPPARAFHAHEGMLQVKVY